MSKQQLQDELDAVYRSTSWRITAPLRFIASRLKIFKFMVTFFKQMATATLRRLGRYKFIVLIAKYVLRLFPVLRERIRAHVLGINKVGFKVTTQTIKFTKSEVQYCQLDDMSDESLRIFFQLKNALNNKK